jgi:hypothetical protein
MLPNFSQAVNNRKKRMLGIVKNKALFFQATSTFRTNQTTAA